MKHLLGVLHLQTILNTKEDDILKISIEFVNNFTWTHFPVSECINDHEAPIHNLTKSLNKLLSTDFSKAPFDAASMYSKNYPKQEIKLTQENINQKEIINLLYITFEAYLDAFRILEVQNTLEALNKTLQATNNTLLNELDATNNSEDSFYYTTEIFIKKYRSIYQLLKEIMILFPKMKANNKLSDDFKIFNNIVGL